MEKITAERVAEIAISIVSHAQIHLIENLLHDIDTHCCASSFELILTLNLEEALPFVSDSFSFPIKVIHNSVPKGFAANHNQAFTHASGKFFCVMNPDIRITKNPFPVLITSLRNSTIGVAAPIIVNAKGALEDSARQFPTPLKILGKIICGGKSIDYAGRDQDFFPDWVGGMFMLFPNEIFREVGGFDTRFFLYYEDVDLCARLKLRGYRAAVCHDALAIHDARRSSHTNLRYLLWHVMSALRFFLSPVYRQLQKRI